MSRFSVARIWAIFVKEVLQMRRDRLTLGMIVGVPLMQLCLFGFAINFNPKALPTAVSVADSGPFARSIVAALRNSSYFEIVAETNSPRAARAMLQRGDVLFVVEIPVNFTRDIMRGQRPDLLIEADATDPAAGGFAMSAFQGLAQTALRDDLKGPLATRAQGPPPFNAITHMLYNPESNTQYSIVPGLLAIILTMTMVLMTCLALTRERERGTYENLLAMPATPIEIMIGKIAPNVMVGALQSAIILAMAKFVFAVPMAGSMALLALALAIYVVANLAVGYTFSTIAESQLQAMQMMTFFLLPAILLSGFAFPFAGMPVWAQWVSEFMPLTHYVRIVRAIMLKGATLGDLQLEAAALVGLTLLAMVIAVTRFRRTLD